MMLASHSSRRIAPVVASALALTALADRLLDGPMPGYSLAVHLAAVMAAALFLNRHVGGRRLMLAAGAGGYAVFALAENVSDLSLFVSLLLAGLVAILLSGWQIPGAGALLMRLAQTGLHAPFALISDALRVRRSARSGGCIKAGRSRLTVWVLPIGAGIVFLFLFALANPVLDAVLAQINFWLLFELLDPLRILFWIAVLAGVWPLLRPGISRWRKGKALPVVRHEGLAAAAPVSKGAEQGLFGEAAILRSLIIFNALFAMQTVMDAAYLWGGIALPEGMSYAAYAHRGAYPLIVTALLAAGFVLAATRPGTPAASNRTILALVGLWIVQNIGLVLSSILRLDLYVTAYGLTHWRVAAFLWMGLVATGLALILIRIKTRKSIDWLVGTNLMAASCVLALSCLVDFSAAIAHANVDRQINEPSGRIAFDPYHLVDLGPSALPAIARLLSRCEANGIFLRSPPYCTILGDGASRLVRLHEETQRDWRGRSLRSDRLAAWLDANPGST
jgi:hypothetical protein